MSDKVWEDSLGDIADDIPENMFEAIDKINALKSENENLQRRVEELERRLFLEGFCPYCGSNEFFNEGSTKFCDGCKSMMFENEQGGYEIRQAHMVRPPNNNKESE